MEDAEMAGRIIDLEEKMQILTDALSAMTLDQLNGLVDRLALRALIRSAGPNPQFCKELRMSIEHLLDTSSDRPNQQFEAALTSAMYPYLEAAGEPPKI